MRAVIFNGALENGGVIQDLYEIVIEELQQKNCMRKGFILRDMSIGPCRGCFACWVKTPGICALDDAGRETAQAFAQSDLAVFITPVTFGGYSSELKKAVDRLIPNISPFFMFKDGEIHHRPRYRKKQKLVVIGVLSGDDAQSVETFTTLVRRNAINMHSPYSAALVFQEGDSMENARKNLREVFTRGGYRSE